MSAFFEFVDSMSDEEKVRLRDALRNLAKLQSATPEEKEAVRRVNRRKELQADMRGAMNELYRVAGEIASLGADDETADSVLKDAAEEACLCAKL